MSRSISSIRSVSVRSIALLYMLYVYTCILSGFDNLRPPAVPPEDGVRWICFTNIPNLPRVHPWEYRPAYLVSDSSRASRIPKLLPHLMLPPDAEYSIYHDGNFRLRVSPCEIVDTLLADDYDWAAYGHPARKCIYDEARILLEDKGMEGWRKQKPERAESIRAEIARYRDSEYPERNGLWANGFIARRHTIGVRDLNDEWWKLYAQGSERDQLSFPVARYEREFPIRTITGNIYQSPYLQFCWHAAWRNKEDNPDFWPERDRTRARLGRLQELAGPAVGVGFESY